ncbi:hypothetical protein ACFQGT_04775 [Natrialbaceae archaeon GCM10025810]|uniref:hypothetical protein n=1 Tax=Halovalidus salilacus TaxID=3075124 RepID=UPI0036179ED8
MANRDDVTRVLAGCTECGSVYTAREWPNGIIRAIGRDDCRCGGTEFEVVDGPDDDRSPSGAESE